jgi:hypothetical protein
MKVYVVIEYDDDPWGNMSVIGIFSTYELAKVFKSKRDEICQVKEFILDKEN